MHILQRLHFKSISPELTTEDIQYNYVNMMMHIANWTTANQFNLAAIIFSVLKSAY